LRFLLLCLQVAINSMWPLVAQRLPKKVAIHLIRKVRCLSYPKWGRDVCLICAVDTTPLNVTTVTFRASNIRSANRRYRVNGDLWLQWSTAQVVWLVM
jgi:hypothetical protein